MATVTAIEAEKAEQILGQSVVSGALNEDGHLILTRANGSTIDAGDFTAIVSGILSATVTAQLNTALPNMVAGTVINKGVESDGTLTIPEFNSSNMPNAMVRATLGADTTFDAASLPSAPKTNTQWVLRLEQDATGGRAFTLTGFKKSLGSVPITTTPGAVDMLVFVYDGANWLVGLMGADFK